MAIINNSPSREPSQPIKDDAAEKASSPIDLQPLRAYKHQDFGSVFLNGFGETTKGKNVAVFTIILKGKVMIESLEDFKNNSTIIQPPKQ